MVDTSCPFYKWLWDDLLKSTEGDSYCTVEYQHDILHGGDIVDYALCNHDNHPSCPRCLGNRELTDRLEREREDYIGSMPHTD